MRTDSFDRDYLACFFAGKQPTPDALAAIKSLEKLDDAHLAMGYVTAKERDDHWRRKGYVAKSGSIRRLVGKRAVPWTNDPKVMSNAPPGDDHGHLFLKAGKPAFYLSEPYGITFSLLCEIVAFCQRWGLQASISASESSWYPGFTVAICYEASESK